MADATGTTVWRWDQQEPFGNNPADEDPDANSVAFDLPLRLPGQRYDAETSLHYNYFRDYDPSLGIYKQSDPIGLKDGLNTYAYVSGVPLHLIDVYGLAADMVARGPWWPDRPTNDQVQKALKDAIKKGRLCLKGDEDCSKLHADVYKLCTGLFANVGAVVCKINADEIAATCILNPDLYRCPKEACSVPPVAHVWPSMGVN